MKDAPVFSAVCSDSTGTTLSYPFRGTQPITSYYGNRVNPVTGVSELHNGMDFGMNYEDVIAPADGIIQTVTWDASGGGNMMVIWHPQLNLRTGYLHLSQMLMRPGDTVQLGQKFAVSGNTGTLTTGDHLHFAVLQGQYGAWESTSVDPLSALKDCVREEEGSINNGVENSIPERCLGYDGNKWGNCRFRDSSASLEFYIDTDGNIIDTKALQPYPYINYIERHDNHNKIYGIAPNRGQKIDIKVNRLQNKYCWARLPNCYKSETIKDYAIPYSFVELFKYSNNGIQQIEQVPNTDTGVWSIEDLNGSENDTYFAIWKVHGKFNYYNSDLQQIREYDFLYDLEAISEKGNRYQANWEPLKVRIKDRFGLDMINGNKPWSRRELELIFDTLTTINGKKYYSAKELVSFKRYDQARSGSDCHNENGNPYDAAGTYNYTCKHIAIYDNGAEEIQDPNNDSSIPIQSRYGPLFGDMVFRNRIIHELMHAYQRYDTQNTQEFADISWNTGLGFQLNHTNYKENRNACDFTTAYMYPSLEDMAESYTIGLTDPDRFNDVFEIHKRNGVEGFGYNNSKEYVYFPLEPCGENATYQDHDIHEKELYIITNN